MKYNIGDVVLVLGPTDNYKTGVVAGITQKQNEANTVKNYLIAFPEFELIKDEDGRIIPASEAIADVWSNSPQANAEILNDYTYALWVSEEAIQGIHCLRLGDCVTLDAKTSYVDGMIIGMDLRDPQLPILVGMNSNVAVRVTIEDGSDYLRPHIWTLRPAILDPVLEEQFEYKIWVSSKDIIK